MKLEKFKVCKHCKGKGKIEIITYFPCSKLEKIIKKYKLTQTKVATIVGVNVTLVNQWVRNNGSKKGIKSKYFDLLAKKGYK